MTDPISRSELDEDADTPLSADDRVLARWTAIGLAAAVVTAIGGVLIELIFS